MRSLTATFGLLILGFSLTTSIGCKEFGNPLKPETMTHKPFQKPTETSKSNAPAGESQEQQSAKLEDYQRPTYPNGVRRNPFQPDPAFLIQQAEFETENSRVKEPLEVFGIGQLRLAAIISGITVPKAMFIDPSGLGHFAKVGDRIGEGGMIITAIRESSVTLSSQNDTEETNGDLAGSTQIIRLSDQTADDEQLSDEDRADLERILHSKAGQKAAQKTLTSTPNNTNNSTTTAPGNNGGQ